MDDLKETIERVRELDAKAFPGIYIVDEKFGDVRILAEDPDNDPWTLCHMTDPLMGPEALEQRLANANLFAHYRTAAPKLATACEELLEENAKLSADLANSKRVSRDRFDKIMEALEQRDAAEKQRDTLRGLIEAAPHAHDCQLGRPNKLKTGTVDFPCTCWKSRALPPAKP